MLFLAVKTLKDSGHEHVYNAVEKPLQLAQTAAVLEVFHHWNCTQLHFVFFFSFHQLNCLNLHPFFSGPVSISFWSVDSSRSSRWIPLLLLIYFLFIIIIMFFGVFKICLLLCNDEGLVRSPITATLPQIGSRLYLTWVILYSVPEVGIILPSKLPILM